MVEIYEGIGIRDIQDGVQFALLFHSYHQGEMGDLKKSKTIVDWEMRDLVDTETIAKLMDAYGWKEFKEIEESGDLIQIEGTVKDLAENVNHWLDQFLTYAPSVSGDDTYYDYCPGEYHVLRSLVKTLVYLQSKQSVPNVLSPEWHAQYVVEKCCRTLDAINVVLLELIYKDDEDRPISLEYLQERHQKGPVT